MFNLIYLGILILFCLIAGLIGLKRGLFRSTFRLVTFVAAIPLSVLLSRALIGFAKSVAMDALAGALGDYEVLLAPGSATEVALFALVSALVAPILFLAVYLVVEVLLFIVYKILYAIFKKPLNRISDAFPKILNKGVGALAGVLAGFVFVGALLTPVIGYVNIADRAVDDLLASGILDDQRDTIEDVRETYVVPASGSAVAKVLYAVIVKPTFNALTTVRGVSKSGTLESEIGVWCDTIAALKDIGGIDAESVSGLKGAVETMDDSVLIAPAIAEVISGMMGEWAKGNSYAGVKPIQMDGLPESLLHTLESSYARVTAESVKDDMLALVDLFELLVDKDIGNADMVEIVRSEGFLRDVFRVLNSNDKLRPLIPEFVALALNAAGDALNIKTDDLTNRDVVIEDADAEADALLDVVNALTDIKDDAGVKETMEALGNALDGLKEMETVGADSVKTFTERIFESDTVTESISIDKEQAKTIADAINNGASETDYGSVMGSIGESAQIAEDIANAETIEEKVEKVEELMGDLNETTATVIKELVSADTFSDFGVSQQTAEGMTDLFHGTVDSLTEYKATASPEDYQREVEAVSTVMNMISGESTLNFTDSPALVKLVRSEVLVGEASRMTEGGSVEDPMGLNLGESEKEGAISALLIIVETDPTLAEEANIIAALAGLNYNFN